MGGERAVAEFEEKLNSILGNPQAMEQIMTLARSLSGEEGRGEGEAVLSSGEEEHGDRSGPPPDLADLADLLGQIDPRMIRTGMEVIRQVQSTEDRNAALLQALRPFLREERRGRLDRAIRIARMTRVVRAAITAFGERGTGEGV